MELSLPLAFSIFDASFQLEGKLVLKIQAADDLRESQQLFWNEDGLPQWSF